MSSPLPSIPANGANARKDYGRRSSKEELLSTTLSTASTPSPALPAIPPNNGTERASRDYRDMRDLTNSHSTAYSAPGVARLASGSPEHLHISHSATPLAALAHQSPSKPAFTETTSDPPKPLDSAPSAPRSTTPNSTPLVALDTDRDRSLELERERERAVGLGLGRIEESPSASSLPPPQPEHRSTPSRQGDRDEEGAIPVGFDEGILRGLCELDCGLPLLADRMKQTMASCREASIFLKKRALIEEEYARAMIKLSRASLDSYAVSEGKAGSYVQTWQFFAKTHETLGDNRLKFATQISDMSDELIVLGKEVEKNRKASKDVGTRLERGLAEQEALVEKARVRFDSSAEELERILVQKQGESLRDPSNIPHAYGLPSTASSSSLSPAAASLATTNSKRSFGKAMSKLKGPKSSAQLVKQEEDARNRVGQSSDAYRSTVNGAQAVWSEYFNLQLPRILRNLKESLDECDLGTQYHLARYSYLFERTLVNDGLTVSPLSADDGPALKAAVESIDHRDDFKTFMSQYALAWQMSGQRGPRRDGPSDDVFMPITRAISPSDQSRDSHASPPARPTFGVDLADQMMRDGVEVPRILDKCCEAIELHGVDSMGIYRLSGTTSRVQRLKAKLDRDLEGVDLLSEENLSDINDISGVLKLWFREMPEPLLTWDLYHGFIEASKITNDRLRHIRLHERVNDLPDPNYATLKFLMGHLDLIRQNEPMNQMGCSNLAIVFGPNLLGAPPFNNSIDDGADGSTALADMAWQCKCIETILLHYSEIFVDTLDG